jgi:uncharacterized protein YgbK (DUF1537 family)
MPCRPLLVLADDLTGAAEVAAIAHEAGLRAVVLTRTPRAPVDADVLVLDTDTRLASPARAARRVRACISRLKKLPHAGFFKKTDSVLRGPVLAELVAATAALGLRRALLVAGNPTLGRTIRQGHCYLDDRPLEQTAFARDLHHPATSSSVIDLLGARPGARIVCRVPGGPLPAATVIVGEHRSAADTARWARALDRHTLPAGAADFFRAWLQARGLRRVVVAPPAAAPLPALLLHGTTAATTTARPLRFTGLRAPSAVRVASALREQGAAAVAAPPLTLNDPRAPAVISRGFARLARTLRDAGAFRHLLIAGGATAARVLRTLGWTRLKVIRVWSPGVVELQPVADPGFTVTLKPGSYPWSASIRRSLSCLFT